MTLADSIPRRSKSNAWYEFEDGEAYIRVSQRYLREGGRRRAVPTLELSSVHRESRHDNCEYDSSVKSTGFMDRIMTEVETIADVRGLVVFVENVLNGFLPEWFIRRGYARVEEVGGLAICFFRNSPEGNVAKRG